MLVYVTYLMPPGPQYIRPSEKRDFNQICLVNQWKHIKGQCAVFKIICIGVSYS